MTGEGPKSVDELKKEVFKDDLSLEIDNWLDCLNKYDKNERAWFEVDFLKKYPEFVKWKKEKDSST